MNEITRIHLGRQPFTIAVDAHKALQEYLQAIKKAVGASHKEVLEEVELRMAELLVERGIGTDKTILTDDITYLKGQLGEPGDFKSDETDADSESAEASDESGSRRLYRDTSRGMVAGVSSGIAAYFSIDPVIVRLLFVLGVLTGGWSIPLYIILWIIVPEAKTPSEQLQMQGKAVTVDSLKQAVDRADIPGAAQRASKSITPFFEKLGLIIVVLIGLGFLFTGICVLLGISVASAWGLLYQDNIFMYGDFSLSPRDFLFGAGIFLSVISVAIGLMVVGVAMVRRKWYFPGWATAGLVGLFFVGIATAGALSAGFASKVEDYAESIKHQKTIQVAEFNSVRIANSENYDAPIRYRYVQAPTASVELKYVGDAKAGDIVTRVEKGVLVVDTQKFDNNPECSGLCVMGSHDMEIIVRAPQLQKVTMAGSGANLEIPDGITQAALDVEVSDGAYVNIGHTVVDKIAVRINSGEGFSSMSLSGLATDSTVYEAINLNEVSAMVPRAYELSLETNKVCGTGQDVMGSGVLGLGRMPERGITVNGVLAADVNQLNERRADPAVQNPFRCISLTEYN